MLNSIYFVIKLKKPVRWGAVSLALLTSAFAVTASERLDKELAEITNPEPVTTEQTVAVEPPEPESSSQVKWVCKGCSDIENQVLAALQERGITDRVALAVVMGNIQQESRFQTTICEGGVKTGYNGCHRGGFGLIQWTTVGRYNGLGATAKGLQLDPNGIEAQLAWMFREREWKSVEHKFKTPGQSVGYYMNAAYRWLGWGIHGARTTYANQYIGFIQEA